MSLELRAGERQFVEVVSYTPYDSVLELVNAVATIAVADADEMIVMWAINPDAFDFVFSAKGDEAALRVVWRAEHRRVKGEGEEVFAYRGGRLETCRAFWRALRRLQADAEVDEYARNWRREFPEHDMRELTKAIKALERSKEKGGGATP
jgi:hypothetical protein